MAKIIIRNLNNKTLHYNNNSGNVLNIIHENFIDWMHACGANGRCTTCKMKVLAGAENLSDHSQAELKYKNLGKLIDNERLACQCEVTGDLEIMVPTESQLPHLKYTD